MSFVDFVTFFLVLEFWVEISGILSFAFYAVVGPLVRNRENDSVANAIFVMFSGGAAPESKTGGRATPLKTSTFDSTMGYPGEDVA